MNNRRSLNLAGFLICAALMGYALYAQYGLELEPCPLCIFQRIGVITLGVVFLLAALHNPSGSRCHVGVVGLVLIRLPAGREVTKSRVSRSGWKAKAAISWGELHTSIRSPDLRMGQPGTLKVCHPPHGGSQPWRRYGY
jgi:disulfide bond formation protein DsbB